MKSFLDMLMGLARWIPSKYIPLLGTLVVLIALAAFGSFRYDHFFSLETFFNQFNNNAALGMAAIGGTFVILSGGIDLSVGSMIACGTIAISYMIGSPSKDLLLHAPIHPFMAWIIVLAGGALMGTVMGLIIELSELPPFLVTLAFMFVARGLGFRFYAEQLSIYHPWYRAVRDLRITLDKGVYIDVATLCFMGALLIAVIVLHMTKFGRSVYALGDDEHSASLMGLPTARTKVMVYAIAGFCSAAAAILQTLNAKAGDPAGQMGWELKVIAAVVIGGTLLTGGVGFVLGTLLGVLILGLIDELVRFEGINNAAISPIVTGVLLLVFILLQQGVAALSRRAAKMAAMAAAQAKVPASVK